MTTTITKRQLLRESKSWEKKLAHGNVDEIIVPDKKRGIEYVITVRKPKTSLQKFLEKVRKKSFPNLERPDEDII
jgi:hypothetical protein